MKIEKLTVTRNKKTYSGDLVWPDNLSQAVALLGEFEVWEAFRVGYKELAKKRIAGSIRPRKRWLKVDLSVLDEQSGAWLAHYLETLKAQKKAEEELKNRPVEAQQTSPSDSDEMQEEALTQSPASDDSFEEDFAKYLASLDSLPQSQTEESSELLG